MASKHLWKTKITANDSTQQEELGAVRKEWNGTDSCFKSYKYVQASLASTTVGYDGLPLAWYNVGGNVATNDISTTKSNLPAGVAIGALTSGNYGWIQFGGYHGTVRTNGADSITDGMSVLLHDTVDGQTFGVAVGTAASVKILGVAVAADTDAENTVAVLLDCAYGDIIQ